MADTGAATTAPSEPAAQTNQPILTIAGLEKTFGTFTALHSVDLKVREGEFLTIVGPSGSGKSTLIRLLVGMDEPTEGTIWLRNQRIDTVPAAKRPTCMVFQSLALFPHRSVGQNIEFPLKIRGVGSAERKARALELLALLRLPSDYYGKRIQQCSGGEKQRVALARALAFDPEILFFDEPLSALDYRLRKTLEKELKDLHDRTGKTFVYITHSLEEAMVMSDRIAIMRAGRFEQIATPDEIYARPRSRFVAEFMGEVNLFEIRATEAGVTCDGVTLNPDAAARLGLAPGESGALVVRPETLHFLPPDGDADAIIEGTLHTEYALGSRHQYEVDLPGGGKLTAEVLREDRVNVGPGAPVRLGWDLATAHIIQES
ncbi:ABC transporter ATP-binding protein [Acuticoccus sp. MNP-M23]|uniref:ABC transporter ATP-binding protein n=1 Tax=Acuticoccus sp. MNP-M23 TaxID=3072793 RepID=UPI0028163422|nr:ABC transporter ATP-binding protein [Acuticoccus sp. MNP-M23]WMS42358.1 ABC transporter ATP-binding protein [Acuticoccus sp. MNP-M23]